ncbi:SigE family RNA polymerase sigma factor [Kribbella sp. NPDC023972]|jgi:RNA polymerase sigma-70 factor (sigma-E family)|uniref:SigE family RNA polymerase sigma factor n=1 Tax=Kribbella sp. NPDC023972 TaxID=3154795 RepID=UPI0033C55467
MRRRDEDEFTEFAAVTVRRLRRTAYLMCGDWHRAEDAAQDALVKVYRRWHRIDRGDALVGYAHRAVVTAVLDQSRRPWRREHLDDPGDHAGPAPDALTAVDDRAVVIQALAALAPGQRACVVLRHYADFSVDQTADILGIGAGAVKSQTSRGLAQLRDLLGINERSAS